MINTAIQLMRKDLRLFLRDKTALLLALLLPIVLATVFGTAMKGMSGGGSSGGVKALPLVVEDLDNSELSRKLLDAIGEQDGIRVVPSADARKQVRNGDVAMGLIVESGYSAKLEAGEIPTMRLLKDPSRGMSVQVLSARLLPAIMMQTIDSARGPLFRNLLGKSGFPAGSMDQAEVLFNSTYDRMTDLAGDGDNKGIDSDPGSSDGTGAEGTNSEGRSEGDSPAVASSAGGMDFLSEVPAMLGVVSEDVMKTSIGPPRNGGVSHAFAAMAVMMLMFSLVAGAGTLLDEQQQGTLMRLRLIPQAGDAILLGKTMFLGCIGLMQLGTLFLFGIVAFDLPVMEHAFELVVISLSTVYAVAGLGMLFATLCKSRKQLEGSSTLIILGMSAVGGAWFPREMTPDIFQTIGNFTMTAWSMDAYHGVMWYGKKVWPHGELSGVWPQLALLLGVGTVLLLLARVMYRKRFASA